MSASLKGVITALVTPFKDGEVDYASFKRLLKAQDVVDGFVINGTTAESPTLTGAEVKKLYETARAETSNKAIIVGTGNNSTAKTAEFTREVCQWNPDAVLVVVPYYNKPPQRGLVGHFGAVASSAGRTSVILYNVPGRTITSLEPATVGQIAKEHANVVAIKDATGDMKTLTQIKDNVAKDFVLLSGDDGTCVEFAKLGGHGVISVSSHLIGAEMKTALKEKSVEAYKEKFTELMKYLYIEANPIPVKQALYWQGVIDSPEMRLPLVAMDEKYHKEFQACLKKIGKL